MTPEDVDEMRERLRRCADVSAFCMKLRRAFLQDASVKGPVPDLRRIAARLAEILGPDQCVIVGALAVAVHGHARATDHVDLLTRLHLTAARKLLRAHGLRAVRRQRDAQDSPTLQGFMKGIRFVILPEVVPIRWDCAVRLSVGRQEMKILDLDALLRLKLRAGGPLDLMDTAHLLLQHPERIVKAREMARVYGLEDQLEMWLKDSRVRSRAKPRIAHRQEGDRKRGSDG